MEAINIHGEVRKLIADCLARGETQTVSFYVNAIMANHSDIEGEDADFYLICARSRIKEIVSVAIGKFKPKADASDRQLVLDGFEHLQIAYTFERDGETALVPIDHCGDFELNGRAIEFDEMAKGCRAHAREIREYVAARAGQAA